ncbi:hypothetical protein OK074_6885 [Actinobacteria bacterium OK074]|nr:hypothetical protein OK074_6885 [Actinobacteria bacterium OK074]
MAQSVPPEEPTTVNTNHSVSIPPNGMRKLDLGEYPDEQAIPDFLYDYIPDRHEFISADEKHIETENGVRLVVHFQNYGDVEALVTAQPIIGQ